MIVRCPKLAFLAALGFACRPGGEPDQGEVPSVTEAAKTEKTGHFVPPEAASAVAPSTTAGVPPVRQDGTILGEATLMGTRVTINVWVGPDGNTRSAGAAIERAFGEIARLESIASEWQPTSDISRLNASAGAGPIEVAPELIEILERSAAVSRETGGLFDVTFYAVGSLWSFDPGASPPSADRISARRKLVNWRAVSVDPTRKTAELKRKGMQAGLGGIAKGYAVDAASQLLREAGFPNHIVEGGGDTYIAGKKGDLPWQVGVKDPRGGGTIAALPMQDRAVVTSGTYERYFEYDGKYYTHILDPRTGWPIERERSPLSVTVVAPNATDADAYATAIAVMGAEQGMRFVEARPTVEAVIIDADGSIHTSSGLAADLVTRSGG